MLERGRAQRKVVLQRSFQGGHRRWRPSGIQAAIPAPPTPARAWRRVGWGGGAPGQAGVRVQGAAAGGAADDPGRTRGRPPVPPPRARPRTARHAAPRTPAGAGEVANRRRRAPPAAGVVRPSPPCILLPGPAAGPGLLHGRRRNGRARAKQRRGVHVGQEGRPAAAGAAEGPERAGSAQPARRGAQERAEAAG